MMKDKEKIQKMEELNECECDNKDNNCNCDLN